jgi:hypothetical protein
MSNEHLNLPDSDFFSNRAARLISARTGQDLRASIFERYDQVKRKMNLGPHHNQNEIAKNGQQFELDNPGYSAVWAPTINDWGMRQAHDVLEQVDTCFYGCSITYGSGVSDEVMWPSQLSQRQGWTYNNFGFSGLSHDECVNLFITTSRMINMRQAVFLLPDYTRTLQAFREKGSKSVYYYVPITGIEPDGSNDVKDFFRDYNMLPRLYLYEKLIRNLELIKYVAQQNNIKVYISSWCGLRSAIDALNNNEYTHVPVPFIDHKGRDGLHPGCDWHTQVADRFDQAVRAGQ